MARILLYYQSLQIANLYIQNIKSLLVQVGWIPAHLSQFVEETVWAD